MVYSLKNSMKKALITGITGQDGFFLSQLLLNKGYEVHGLVRNNAHWSLGNLSNLPQEFLEKIVIHWGDITDFSAVSGILKEEQFDELYHLAAQSFVGLSFDQPRITNMVNIIGTQNVVDAIKTYSPHTKLYFAATSELFGGSNETHINEQTPFYPKSPYGITKLAGYWIVKNNRESYDLKGSNGILFNHESEFRGKKFVTRKITKAVAAIKAGTQDDLYIGDMSIKRDWGFAGDYVEAMWRMLQQDIPDDYVIATGENHTIREFIERAFNVADIGITWEGEGVDEVGRDASSGKLLVKVSPEFFRPAENKSVLGDASKAREVLGWKPTLTFDQIVERMVRADLKRAKLL